MEPGDRLAERYELIARIGHGGMGEVWRAVQVALDRTVAIKVIHPVADSARAELMLQRFQREAELVGRVDHRHVIDVIDYGTTEEGDPFLVMPFLVGETFEQRMRRQPSATVAEVLKIMRALMGGLAAIHDAGIVHRDLKPANVFLAQDSDGVVPKLLDFGISREGDVGESALTQENMMIGTPAYMAPEQFESARTVDHRADIFGLGAMLYEALGGRTPYGGGDAFKVYRSVIETDAPPLSELRPELPKGLAALVERAIAKSPDARWPSVRAMRAALDELARGADFDAMGLALSTPDTPSPGLAPHGAATAWQPAARSPTPQVGRGTTPPAASTRRSAGPWIAATVLTLLAAGAVTLAVVDPFGEPPVDPVLPPVAVEAPSVDTPSVDAEPRWTSLGVAENVEALAIRWARLSPSERAHEVHFFRVGARWVAAASELTDEARPMLFGAFGGVTDMPTPSDDAMGLEPRLLRTTVRLSLHEGARIETPDVRVVPHDTLVVGLLGDSLGSLSALADEGRQTVFLVASLGVSGWGVARFTEPAHGCRPLPGPLVRASDLDASTIRRTTVMSRTSLSRSGRRQPAWLMAAFGDHATTLALFAAPSDCGPAGELIDRVDIPGRVTEYFLTETEEGGDSLLVASWSRGPPRSDGVLRWTGYLGGRAIWRDELPSADFVSRGRASVSGRRDRALRADETHALVIRVSGERTFLRFDGSALVPDV